MSSPGDVSLSFDSIEDELSHWKSVAQEAREEVNELEEFMESSRDIERAMEKEVQGYEKRLKEVTAMFNRFKEQSEEREAKHKANRRELLIRIDDLESKVEDEANRAQQVSRRAQELEQENDDLTRTNRELEATVRDTSQQLESILVETAGLQSELDAACEKNERLKTSLSEARSELAASDKRMQRLIESQTDENHSFSSITTETFSPHVAGTTSVDLSDVTRDSPLNLVDEMLLLVKNLEDRLAKCKGQNAM